MFYPQLEKLKKEYSVSTSVIEQLDMWLALLTKSEREGFDSDFFAREYGLDYTLVDELFSYVVDIGLLQVNFDIYCPECQELVNRYNEVKDIPEVIICDNGHSIAVTENIISLSYTLKQKPQQGNFKKKDSLEKQLSGKSIQQIKENVYFRKAILDKQFYFPDFDRLTLLVNEVERSFTYKGNDEATVKGKALEKFSKELFDRCIAFKCSPDVRTLSNQIDVKVNIIATAISHPFIDKLGRVFLIECKNKSEKITSRIISEVDSILSDYQCDFGVVIGRNTLTGESRYRDANARRFKIYYDSRRVIVVLTFNEIKEQIISQRKSLVTLLEEKYDEFLDQC